MGDKLIKLFLRLALAAGFLSAVGDRLGFWSRKFSVWGDWDHFLAYTHKLNPWAPPEVVPLLGGAATLLETVFALCLLVGYRTALAAHLSGWLLLIFGATMTYTLGIKAPLDASVFAASAAAFALSRLKEPFLEFDGGKK